MSHDRGRRAACGLTIWILRFHLDESYDSTRRDGHGRWLWRLVGLFHDFAFKIDDHRLVLSSADVSSIRVAIVHTWPEGSMIRHVRSPQNWSCGAIRTFAPAATARANTASMSSA